MQASMGNPKCNGPFGTEAFLSVTDNKARRMNIASDRCCLKAAQCGKARGLKIATVEHVECVERNQALAVRVSDVDAALLYAAHIESFCVDELHDEDPEEIFVSKVFRD